MRSIIIGSLAFALLGTPATAQTPSEQAQILENFRQRLADYAQRLECADPGHVAETPRVMTLPVAMVLRQMVATAAEGHAPATSIGAIGPAAPRRYRPEALTPFPASELRPLPVWLAHALPPLPPRFEYRLIGEDLVLRDVEFNLIVDVLFEAVRPDAGGRRH